MIQSNHEIFELLLRECNGNIDVRNLKEETPLHIVMQKLSNAATHLDMICARNKINKANMAITPRSKVAMKLKHADSQNIHAELRLKAIGEQLIMAGADLSAQEQTNWSYVHLASKSFSHDTIRWMLAINEALRQYNMDLFDFEQPGGSNNWTPLHVACYTGSFEVIQELIERAKCDVFSRTLNNKLPRQVARNTIVAKVLRVAERQVVEKQLCMDDRHNNQNQSAQSPSSRAPVRKPQSLQDIQR